jgi:DNA polymerase elongation subunit (family B)
VDRLLQLRLVHKWQARAAPVHSAAAREHDAVQAAMKIVLNSAYGYLAAGRMALFADRAAADEVTRRGREILGQVADQLREQGLVLLEADTDGVFAAAPGHWTAEEERTCVAAVAATLPEGLALEYEGRYRAMLSHEVKNYALLTYDGELIVRGAALHSSRSEPFGERFLREALWHLLAGDVPGVLRVYQDTVSALRERRVALAEVAVVARLTKTPEEYARTRGRAREAAYEALLAAGRTTWRAGERVRFYRAANGRAVWLPDVPENDLASTDDPQVAAPTVEAGPGYDVTHYLAVLQTSYVSRLRKAFSAEDFAQLFRPSRQAGLFDRPLAHIHPQWIEAAPPRSSGAGTERRH